MNNQSEGPWTLSCGHEVLDKNQTHYCSYIGLAPLLSIQQPNVGTDRARDFFHDDEFQFVLVHQVCELSFRQILEELPRTIRAMQEDRFDDARKLAERMTIWMDHARRTAAIFRTMSPASFNQFRDKLAPASGAESIQYRLIEIRSGIREDTPYAQDRGVSYNYRAWLDRAPGPAEGQPKTRWWTSLMTQAAKEPSLASTLDGILLRKGLTIAMVYATHDQSSLSELVTALYEFEKTFVHFRSASASGHSHERRGPDVGHLEVAQGQIGSKPGSGHSSGVPYLHSTAETARFFPELWRHHESRNKSQ